MSVLLALDPGGRTGWSLWRFDAITPITHLEHGTVEGGLDGFIAWWKVEGWHPDVVVSETFVLDGRTPRPDVTPLKIEGALSVLFPGWVGQRNTFKAHAPDTFLKENDLWWPGLGHDRDSARHAIAFMKTSLHRPTLERYWGGRRRGLQAVA